MFEPDIPAATVTLEVAAPPLLLTDSLTVCVLLLTVTAALELLLTLILVVAAAPVIDVAGRAVLFRLIMTFDEVLIAVLATVLFVRFRVSFDEPVIASPPLKL